MVKLSNLLKVTPLVKECDLTHIRVQIFGPSFSSAKNMDIWCRESWVCATGVLRLPQPAGWLHSAEATCQRAQLSNGSLLNDPFCGRSLAYQSPMASTHSLKSGGNTAFFNSILGTSHLINSCGNYLHRDYMVMKSA